MVPACLVALTIVSSAVVVKAARPRRLPEKSGAEKKRLPAKLPVAQQHRLRYFLSNDYPFETEKPSRIFTGTGL